MALPEKAFEFSIDDATIDDLIFLEEVIEAGGQFNFGRGGLRRFAALLEHATNWDKDEIGGVRVSDLSALIEMVSTAMAGKKAEAVSPPSTGTSEAGAQEPEKPSPAG